MCVVALERLQDQLAQNPDDLISVSRLVKQVEQRLGEGLQRFPGDSYLADAEMRLAKVIGQDQRAIRALERALAANVGNTFVAKALARLYEEQGDVPKARTVLEKCLDLARADKTVNGSLARLLTKYFPNEGQLAEQYWRRSFTEGDANFHNQFWYARQLYVNGQTAVARALFKRLGAMPGAPEAKLEIKGLLIDEEGRPKRFFGNVQRLESTYAWLSRDGEAGGIFLHRSGTEAGFWDSLTSVSRVSYELGFNQKGPAAVRPAIVASALSS
jgi:tetratricopeptide (TPR) repeat protein